MESVFWRTPDCGRNMDRVYMKRAYTISIVVITDLIFSMLSLYFGLLLRFDGVIPDKYAGNIRIFIPVGGVVIFSYLLGCYKEVWQYTGLAELLRQGGAVALTCVFLLILKYSGLLDMPGSVIIISGGLIFAFTSFIRLMPRFVRRIKSMLGIRGKDVSRTLIVGAGASGALLIKYLYNNNNTDLICPVACVDDDPNKKNLRICGVRVFGSTDEIKKIARKCKANGIIISIPSADAQTIRKIYEKCLPCGLPIKLFQNVVDAREFLKGKRSALKEVSIEDLLFRESINCGISAAEEYIREKTVLVTGGAGSIGSELCRQTLKNGCRKLIIFDICENALFELNEELKAVYPKTRYELLLGSVQDRDRIDYVFSEYRPQLVFHAAAHKHVPIVEINPSEAVKNNIIGTKNVVEACKKYKAAKFILISTDKAVNPTNVMGASKRIAELIVKAENGAGTEMASVRFGNVLGSVGSVVPLFKKQIASGGPVTLTDPEMRRYFMTIPEAVSLVQTAAALAKGGETFVLDMGQPVRIYDLACDLIRLSGLEPNRDIDIVITGLRPGEKLFEELSLDSESVDATSYKKIFVMRSGGINRSGLYRQLSEILACEERQDDPSTLRSLIFGMLKDGVEEKTAPPVPAAAVSLR